MPWKNKHLLWPCIRCVNLEYIAILSVCTSARVTWKLCEMIMTLLHKFFWSSLIFLIVDLHLFYSACTDPRGFRRTPAPWKSVIPFFNNPICAISHVYTFYPYKDTILSKRLGCFTCPVGSFQVWWVIGVCMSFWTSRLNYRLTSDLSFWTTCHGAVLPK